MGNKLKRVLITGASGYLGSRLVKYLENLENLQLVLIGRDPDKLNRIFKNKHEIYSYSQLLDKDTTPLRLKIEIVVHLSAINEIGCLNNPVNAFKVNVLDTERILNLSISSGVERFIYLSTVHIYNNSNNGIVDERMIPHPDHPYSATHLYAENFIYNANRKSEISGVIIRLANSFGYPAHQNIERWTLLVNNLCLEIAKTGKVILKSDGSQTRDFITITDAVRGISFFFDIKKELIGDGVFNLGGENSKTIKEMSLLIIRLCNEELKYNPELILGKKIDEDKKNMYSIDKLKKIGFNLIGNTEEEIKKTLRFCWDNFHE